MDTNYKLKNSILITILGIIVLVLPMVTELGKVGLIICIAMGTLIIQNASRIVKQISISLSDKVTISDSVSIIVKDKDGNIKSQSSS